MSDFGFVGSAYEASSLTQDAQQLINFYPEIDPTKQMIAGGSVKMDQAQGDRGVIALYPTPGTNQVAQLDTIAVVRGCHVLPGGSTSIVACGNILYTLTVGYSAARIGTLLSSTGPVSITDNGICVYIGDGSNRYFYVINPISFNGTISGTTLTVNSVTSGIVYIGMTVSGVGVTAGTTISSGSGSTWVVNHSQTVGPVAMTGNQALIVVTDGAFNGASIVDVTDNYIVYNNPNSNQWGCTDVGAITSNALNFAATLSAPGNVVGLIADHRQVYLLSEYTTEVWADVGAYPFPFQIIPGSTMQHGCAAAGSIARFGEGFAFLSQDRLGRATVVLMNGYQPTRISTHAIEEAINSYPITSDAVAYAYVYAGHAFYVLTFPSADITWVYDLSSEMWHRRAWRDSNNILHRHRSNCGMFFGNQQIVGDYQNGKLYSLVNTAYTDNGDPILRRRRCQHLTNDLKRVFYSNLQIQFQPGVGNQTSPGTDPKCIISWSDDGGFTFGNDHVVSIGKVGKYKNRAMIRRLGYGRDRVFNVDIMEPVYTVIVSANLDASVGVN